MAMSGRAPDRIGAQGDDMPDHKTKDKLLYSRKEATQLLSLSLRTIDKLICSKELKVRRIGRKVLIHREVIEAFARRDTRVKPRTPHISLPQTSEVEHDDL
jgi:excisionase family DNA binding protein